MREPLEDICKRVAERFESLDCDEKRSGLEALDVTAIVTDVQVEINTVLGVKEPDSRLITTEQTSGCHSVGACNYRAIYALAPVAAKALNPWSPSKGHQYLPVAFSFL